MEDQKLGRREFLKLTIATAAAGGLSHFKFLNVGGPGAAFAQTAPCTWAGADLCDPTGAGGAPEPDMCNPAGIVPEEDVCAPPATRGQDYQCPTVAGAPDICAPPEDADLCSPAPFSEPDACDPQGDPAQDYVCPDALTSGDTCTPPADADLCAPTALEEDVPCQLVPADECYPRGGGLDICRVDYADICDPSNNDPDSSDTTAVTLSSLNAAPTSVALPVAGGLAALAAAAAVWLRSRLRPSETDEPDTE